MTAKQFNSDSLEERTKLVWTRGSFIAMRELYSCRVVLYHLEELFAEVWYHPESNVILTVHGFDKLGSLEPYLDYIYISELIEKK